MKDLVRLYLGIIFVVAVVVIACLGAIAAGTRLIAHMPTSDNRATCGSYINLYATALTAPVEQIAVQESAYWKAKYIEAGCLQ